RELAPRGAAVTSLVAQGVIVSNAPFGDENDVLPALAKSPGEEPLGVAKAIPLGRVEAIDSEIQGTMDSADDFRVIKVAIGATQFPATETNRRHIQTSLAKGSILHVILPTTGVTISSMHLTEPYSIRWRVSSFRVQHSAMLMV